MNAKWDNRFLELAAHIATWSKDPSSQVGCVIVNHNKTITSIGYNGFPRGVVDHQGRYDNRELKYLMVQHAEANAITTAKQSLQGHTLYVTHHPCCNCAGLIIQTGICRVVTHRPQHKFAERFKDSIDAAQTMFREANVTLDII